MNRTLLLLIALILTRFSSGQVVPQPQSIKALPGASIGGDIIRCDEISFRPQADAFSVALAKLGAKNARIQVGDKGAPFLVFKKDKTLTARSYAITMRQKQIVVKAPDSFGVAHAAATLLQLAVISEDKATFPRVKISDIAERPFRCFMIDMGRNPHSPRLLRSVVDMMWLFKANYLHLHLSDDQLFSWPSKTFPKLQSKNAGWTLGDFESLESYAQARGVTIIPELDVPGHSTILRRAYPEVFGKTPSDLAASPKAQKGIENLIAEMLQTFKSSPYMHIGGDEAYGVPQNSQRDFINRLNRFVKSLGKTTIVWEGPPLGKDKFKVSEDVLHVNWRTINFPAQQMLDAGYQVIAAPWDPLYVVDHYPRTMFTAVDVERCYNWDIRRFAHINHEIRTYEKPHYTKTDEGILGFCMPWWEGREENLLPLCLPRLAAVTAAAWNRQGESNFASFETRQENVLRILSHVSDVVLPKLPMADPDSQKLNLAFRARVKSSSGQSQPHFGPARLTNGITNRFDHFLGFPTQPKPLKIDIVLEKETRLDQVVVFETAVGKSHEIYDVFVSRTGKSFEKVGSSRQGTRGEDNFVEHDFKARKVKIIRIETQGCHGLTFPSFSRLTEIKAYLRQIK